MRAIGLALLMALLPVPAQAQQDGAPGEILVGIDPETGERVASSAGNSEVRERLGYSAAAQSSIIMWVEARQMGSAPPRVYLVGQQLRYSLPKETRSRGTFGRSDPKADAYVGAPFRSVDLQTRWTEIVCVSDAYYCSRIDEHEIELSPELLTALTATGAKTEIPIALTRRNRIDWRVQTAELVETLAALAAFGAEVDAAEAEAEAEANE